MPDNLQLSADVSDIISALNDVTRKFDETTRSVNDFARSFTDLNASTGAAVQRLEQLLGAVQEEARQTAREIEILRRASAKPIALDKLIQGGFNIPAQALRDIQPLIDRVNNALANGLKTDRLEQIIQKIRQGGVTAFTGLEAQAASAIRGIQDHLNELPGPFTFANNLAKRLGQTLVNLTLIDFARSTIFGFVERVKASVQGAIDFGIKVAEVQTIAARGSQSVGEQFIAFSSKITELANKFGQPLSDVTEGLYQTFSNQVAKGSENILVLESSMRLAQATVSSTADSMNLLTGALNSFQLSAFNSDRVAAELFKTVELGRVRVGEIANTFGRVGPLAKLLGVSLEDTLAALQILTIRGINANEAMTLLNNVMLQLTKPSAEMKLLFDEIGVTSGQAAVGAFTFSGVLQILQNELRKGNTRIAELFPELRAMKGVFSLASQGTDEFNDSLRKTNDAAASFDDALKIIQNNTSKQLQVELNKVSTFITTEFGTNLVKSILDVAQALGGEEGVVGALKKVITTVKIVGPGFIAYQLTVRTLTAATTAYISVSALASRVIGTNTVAIQAQTAATSQATVATNALGLSLAGIQSITGLGILAAGLTSIVVAMNQADESLTEKLTKLQSKLDKLSEDRIKNTRKQLAEEQQEFTRTLEARTRIYLAHTTETVKLTKAASDSNKKIFTDLSLSIRAALGTVTDKMKSDIADLEKAATKAKQFADRAAEFIETLPTNLNERLLDEQLKVLDQRETLLNKSAQDEFARQNNRVVTIQESVKLLTNEVNKLNEAYAAALKRGDIEAAEKTLKKSEERTDRILELRRELEGLQGILPQLPTRPQTLSLSPEGKLVDVTDERLKKSKEVFDVNDKLITQGRTVQNIEEQRAAILAKQVGLMNQQKELREEEANFLKSEIEVERERERLVQRAVQKLVDFKFTKDGKARNPNEVAEELKNIENTINTNIPAGQKLGDIIALEKLITAAKRQASIERIKIDEQETQVRIENGRKELAAREKTARDILSNSVSSGKELLDSLTKDVLILTEESKKIIIGGNLGGQDDQKIKTSILETGAIVQQQLTVLQNEFQSTGKISEETLTAFGNKIKEFRQSISSSQGLQVPGGTILSPGEIKDLNKPIQDIELSTNQLLERLRKNSAELQSLAGSRTKALEDLNAVSEAMNKQAQAAKALTDPLGDLSKSFNLLGASILGNPLGTLAGSIAPDKLNPGIQSIKELSQSVEDLTNKLNNLRNEAINLNFGLPPTSPIPRNAHGGIIGTDTMLSWVSPGETIVDAINSRRFASQLFAIRSGHSPINNNTSNSDNSNINLTINTTEAVDGPRLLAYLKREKRRRNW